FKYHSSLVSSGMPLPRVRVGTILALLVLVTTIPLGLFAAYLIYASWTQQLVIVNRQNVERARAVSVAVDQEVQNTITALNVLATVDPIDTQNLRPFYDLASELVPVHSGWQAVRLVDLQSQVVVNTALPFGAPSSLANDDWVHMVRDSGRPAVSAARKDP